MYAKVFTQIFDSSIAENYRHRHVFEDLLKLADKDGCVDMTAEAISRRANCPLDEVKEAIKSLMSPDDRSRSHEQEGRRLVPIDSRRDWGWVIVNYQHYRAIQDAETLREKWRNSKAAQRAREKTKAKSQRVSRTQEFGPNGRERHFENRVNNGAGEHEQNDLITRSLPEKNQ